MCVCVFNVQLKPQWLICMCILCRNHSHLHAKTQPWANWITSAETVAVWISGSLSSTCLNDETKQTKHITNHTSYCTVFVYNCLGRIPGLSLHCQKEDNKRGKSTKCKQQGNVIHQPRWSGAWGFSFRLKRKVWTGSMTQQGVHIADTEWTTAPAFPD